MTLHLRDNYNPETIKGTPVHLLDEDRLPESRSYFEWMREVNNSNEEVVAAIDGIIWKIDNIMSSSRRSYVSWETMRAANEENYSLVA